GSKQVPPVKGKALRQVTPDDALEDFAVLNKSNQHKMDCVSVCADVKNKEKMIVAATQQHQGRLGGFREGTNNEAKNLLSPARSPISSKEKPGSLSPSSTASACAGGAMQGIPRQVSIGSVTTGTGGPASSSWGGSTSAGGGTSSAHRHGSSNSSRFGGPTSTGSATSEILPHMDQAEANLAALRGGCGSFLPGVDDHNKNRSAAGEDNVGQKIEVVDHLTNHDTRQRLEATCGTIKNPTTLSASKASSLMHMQQCAAGKIIDTRMPTADLFTTAELLLSPAFDTIERQDEDFGLGKTCNTFMLGQKISYTIRTEKLQLPEHFKADRGISVEKANLMERRMALQFLEEKGKLVEFKKTPVYLGGTTRCTTRKEQMKSCGPQHQTVEQNQHATSSSKWAKVVPVKNGEDNTDSRRKTNEASVCPAVRHMELDKDEQQEISCEEEREDQDIISNIDDAVVNFCPSVGMSTTIAAAQAQQEGDGAQQVDVEPEEHEREYSFRQLIRIPQELDPLVKRSIELKQLFLKWLLASDFMEKLKREKRERKKYEREEKWKRKQAQLRTSSAAASGYNVGGGRTTSNATGGYDTLRGDHGGYGGAGSTGTSRQHHQHDERHNNPASALPHEDDEYVTPSVDEELQRAGAAVLVARSSPHPQHAASTPENIKRVSPRGGREDHDMEQEQQDHHYSTKLAHDVEDVYSQSSVSLLSPSRTRDVLPNMNMNVTAEDEIIINPPASTSSAEAPPAPPSLTPLIEQEDEDMAWERNRKFFLYSLTPPEMKIVPKRNNNARQNLQNAVEAAGGHVAPSTPGANGLPQGVIHRTATHRTNGGADHCVQQTGDSTRGHDQQLPSTTGDTIKTVNRNRPRSGGRGPLCLVNTAEFGLKWTPRQRRDPGGHTARSRRPWISAFAAAK
ncbi:unnamed protein product, partial [Amoebophrya sp. A120]